MSNIIDGIDYGMGYESTKGWGPKNQFHTEEGWFGSACPDQVAMDREIKLGVRYRRPLPIISQHPGAIPLEPGEELKVGERYLQANGTRTEPLTHLFDCEYLFYCKKLIRTWTKTGIRSNDGKFSETNLIARLPKVESKDPNKSKAEKVDGEMFVNLAQFDCGHKSDLSMRASIPLSEAARIAQLPEVQAEVERQRAKKEIRMGDWFWTKLGVPDRAQAFTSDTAEVLGKSDRWYRVKQCTKISDPAFIAVLEKGVGNG